MDLEPIDARTAVKLYLADRETEVASTTLNAHRSRLRFFVRWCEENGVTNLNHLNGRQLHQYRIWRRREGDLAPPSEKSQMDTLRVFIRWLGTIDGVDPDLHHKVRSPKFPKGKYARDEMLEAERATDIIAYLERFEYASRDHVVFLLLWHTMLRRGALRALDLEDYNQEEEFISLIHRPDTDTQLKNGKSSQRMIALSSDVSMVLNDYITVNRQSTKDEFGRNPLVTTVYGRPAVATISKTAYKWTRPCEIEKECPHGRELSECKAAGNAEDAFTCPSSVGSHALRRGGITHYLSNDVPQEVVSDRADVSPNVLEKHYDQRKSKDKMEQRRRYLDGI